MIIFNSTTFSSLFPPKRDTQCRTKVVPLNSLSYVACKKQRMLIIAPLGGNGIYSWSVDIHLLTADLGKREKSEKEIEKIATTQQPLILASRERQIARWNEERLKYENSRKREIKPAPASPPLQENPPTSRSAKERAMKREANRPC